MRSRWFADNSWRRGPPGLWPRRPFSCARANADEIAVVRNVHRVTSVTTMRLVWKRATAGVQAANGLDAVARNGFGDARRREGLAEWILRAVPAWWAMRARGNATPARQMTVVETLSLGGRRQMMLVICQGERFLVGCGADEVQTIVHVPGLGSGGSCP